MLWDVPVNNYTSYLMFIPFSLSNVFSVKISVLKRKTPCKPSKKYSRLKSTPSYQSELRIQQCCGIINVTEESVDQWCSNCRYLLTQSAIISEHQGIWLEGCTRFRAFEWELNYIQVAQGCRYWHFHHTATEGFEPIRSLDIPLNHYIISGFSLAHWFTLAVPRHG